MNRVSENQCTVPLDQCQLVNTSKHAPQLSLRDEHCQGMVVIAATTATVKIVERFVNILRNQTNFLRLGMIKWKECKWIDYRDEQGTQIFDVPSSKGDRLQSFFKIFD